MSAADLLGVLEGADESKKAALKLREMDVMFTSLEKVLKTARVPYAKDPKRRKFRYTVHSHDGMTDFQVRVQVRTTRVYLTGGWTRSVPEVSRGPIAVFAMACNDKLLEGNLEMDHGTGDVRFTVCMPVGHLAKRPAGMLLYYVELLHDCTPVLLKYAHQVVTIGVSPVTAAGAALADFNATRATSRWKGKGAQEHK